MERTLVLIKPDAVERRLVGRIIARFEERGLAIVAMKLARLSEKLVRTHYAQHAGKHFYEPLVRFMAGGPTVLLVLEGKNSVAVVRDMMGKTDSSASSPGTIRGDLGLSNRFNLVHGSDSPEIAEKEIALFFKKSELVPRSPSDVGWIYDLSTGEPV
ncbi:MAG: nucleoside-diphosphate kinase [Planctomycetota bacterium]